MAKDSETVWKVISEVDGYVSEAREERYANQIRQEMEQEYGHEHWVEPEYNHVN